MPIALAAAVFVVMFSFGVIRALREELRDTKRAVTSSPTLVERTPAEAPLPSPASPPPAPPTVTPPETSTAEAAVQAPALATSESEPTASASAEPAHTGETTPVLVRASVSGAKFYRHGKQIGMNSVIVDLAPGEKRAFEVDLPGYVSRKVVVDGSQSEVVVVLPRISEAPAAPAHESRDPSKGEAAPSGPQVQAEP